MEFFREKRVQQRIGVSEDEVIFLCGGSCICMAKFVQFIHSWSSDLIFLQFPNCTDENAISVACLDLYYYVTVYGSIKKEVEALPVALTGLQEHQPQNMDTEGVHYI